MTSVTLTIDQLYRNQPGGIATYVRGLVRGLAELDDATLEPTGLGPRGSSEPARDLPLRVVHAPLGLRVVTTLWASWPIGVPRDADVVHATSMSGPFAGGRSGAVHSVALHDLLWRDEPGATTRSGARFHEDRLRLITRREDLRVFTSSPDLGERLVAEGVAPSRLFRVRLGVDEPADAAASVADVRDVLARHDVNGRFTLFAGTREPRKNLERLVVAHRSARSSADELGSLVLVGPEGWGGVDTDDAIVLGAVDRPILRGLLRDATLFAYVPRAEGWGLPPVEALRAGTRVVASRSTPSVRSNDEVVLVDPLEVESIADGLLRALALPDDDAARARRRASVADLTWRNCALDHVAGWR